MASSDWRPGVDVDVLRARAALFAHLRTFLDGRGVLEVDTPVLGRRTVTDPAIESVAAGDDWLQTSPEYFMKRLLAAGSGPVWQFARAFRAEESGRRHNREFTLLEWYRPGFDDAALMDEIDAMLDGVLARGPARRVPFAELIIEAFGVDPLDPVEAGDRRLVDAVADAFARTGRELDADTLDGDDALDLAYAEACEALAGAVFVTDFPPARAALARLRTDAAGRRVAGRFELVVDGVELANGFHELIDADEQGRRFEADRALRAARGQDVPAADERLLAALAHGLPDCAGVALGVDRLLMLQLGAARLDEVMPFADGRC